MGRVLSFLKNVFEKRSYSVDDDYWYSPVIRPATSGVAVDENTAFKNSVVWSCIRVISETIASLPLFVYRRLPGGGKEKSLDHPFHRLLHVQPNPQMTAFQWRETMMAHVLSWGNHYSFLDWARNNSLLGIWPLRPDRMKVFINGDELFYVYRPIEPGSPNEVVYAADEILHVPGLGYNGIMGYSVIGMAREAIGVSMASEELAGRFFSNDATPPLVLKHPQRLNDEVFKRLKASWEESHGGLTNKWKPAILEEGVTVEKLSMPYTDSQFLETRKFQTVEICRFFRVPPHMIQDLDRATFSNIEQQSLDFVVNTIRPWLVRLEQAYLVKLFGKMAQRDFFVEHVVEGLLRGDIASRYQAYSIGRQWGWLSADDVRELENMNPLPAGQGKIYLVPLNMVPADKFEEMTTKQETMNPAPAEKSDEDEKEDKEKEELQSRVEALKAQVEVYKSREIGRAVQDSVRSVVEAETLQIRQALRTSETSEIFELTLDEYYDQLRNEMTSRLTPVVSAWQAFIDSTESGQRWIESYVDRHIKESRGELASWAGVCIHDSTDGLRKDADLITDILLRWIQKRPAVAGESVIQFFNHS